MNVYTARTVLIQYCVRNWWRLELLIRTSKCNRICSRNTNIEEVVRWLRVFESYLFTPFALIVVNFTFILSSFRDFYFSQLFLNFCKPANMTFHHSNIFKFYRVVLVITTINVETVYSLHEVSLESIEKLAFTIHIT